MGEHLQQQQQQQKPPPLASFRMKSCIIVNGRCIVHTDGVSFVRGLKEAYRLFLKRRMLPELSRRAQGEKAQPEPGDEDGPMVSEQEGPEKNAVTDDSDPFSEDGGYLENPPKHVPEIGSFLSNEGGALERPREHVTEFA